MFPRDYCLFLACGQWYRGKSSVLKCTGHHYKISHVINWANLFAINGEIETKKSTLMEMGLQQLKFFEVSSCSSAARCGYLHITQALEK